MLLYDPDGFVVLMTDTTGLLDPVSRTRPRLRARTVIQCASADATFSRDRSTGCSSKSGEPPARPGVRLIANITGCPAAGHPGFPPPRPAHQVTGWLDFGGPVSIDGGNGDRDRTGSLPPAQTQFENKFEIMSVWPSNSAMHNEEDGRPSNLVECGAGFQPGDRDGRRRERPEFRLLFSTSRTAAFCSAPSSGSTTSRQHPPMSR